MLAFRSLVIFSLSCSSGNNYVAFHVMTSVHSCVMKFKAEIGNKGLRWLEGYYQKVTIHSPLGVPRQYYKYGHECFAHTL